MAKLWIANCTLQDHIIAFRLDFDKFGNHDPQDQFRSFRQEKVPSGQQIAIGGDLHKAQIISIIHQLERSGLTKFDEVSKNKPFVVPYIYREELRVPEEAIRRQRNINNGVHNKDGALRRQAAAVGVNKAVLDAASIISPTQTTLEFDQTKQSDFGEKRIEEGYRVDVTAPGPKGGKSKKAA